MQPTQVTYRRTASVKCNVDPQNKEDIHFMAVGRTCSMLPSPFRHHTRELLYREQNIFHVFFTRPNSLRLGQAARPSHWVHNLNSFALIRLLAMPAECVAPTACNTMYVVRTMSCLSVEGIQLHAIFWCGDKKRTPSTIIISKLIDETTSKRMNNWNAY